MTTNTYGIRTTAVGHSGATTAYGGQYGVSHHAQASHS